ncbi:MAG: aspartate aminotransferase family protein [Opitutaceae bacterium]|nr:aspartate aminotransferase family protein [Cytophagales bacterium]
MTNRELFLLNVAQTSNFPLMLEIQRAEGIYMYDNSGKKYTDLISGISVSNVGHRHPRVLEAIKDQLDKYMHLMVYGEYVQAPQTLLAQKICSLLPSTLSSVYFVNSGSEAVEGAMKLAKRYTKRHKIISCFDSYHGSTQGALSIGGNEKLKQNFRPLIPDTERIRFGNTEDLFRIDRETAAFFIETVQGESGVRISNEQYFEALRARCTEVGALLIFDEIQCGFGRTGKFWAFEHYNVVPDILLCAKSMGGGLPLGAFISSNDIMSVLKENPILGHITTFGGNPVCCAASLATIEVLTEGGLLNEVDAKANLFLELLQHQLIVNKRNKGLLMAIEFESFIILKLVIDKAIEKGVITDWFLFCDNAMRIAPPLTITFEEIYQSCAIILDALSEVNLQLK